MRVLKDWFQWPLKTSMGVLENEVCLFLKFKINGYLEKLDFSPF
jgi:hypothetical protein